MGRFSLARKLATSLVVAFIVGASAAAMARLRPVLDRDGPERIASSIAAAADRLESALFDAFAHREAASHTVGNGIVVVSIDEASVKRARETAGGWPWPRAYLGTLVGEMVALGARLVVLDTAFADASRLHEDDARLARALDASGPVVAGFTFGDAPEEGILEPGRWAVLQGSYATRGAALLGAGPLLAEGARLYLVPVGERVEVWLGGYRDRSAAQQEAERLRTLLGFGPKDALVFRELKAEETLDRVTVDVLFAERNGVPFSGEGARELTTFQNLQPPVPVLVASAAAFGNLRLERDEDGKVRGVRHVWRHEGRYYPSLVLAAAMALTGERDVTLERGRLYLGRSSVPVDATGVTRLRFYGPADRDSAPESPYPVIPVLSIVRSAERRAEGKSLDDTLAERLRSKVVFVSFDIEKCERTATPLARSTLHASAWATALDNLLRGDGLTRATADEDGAVGFVMAMLGALVSLLFTRSMRPWRTFLFQFLASAAVGTVYLSWAYRTYRAGLWVAGVVPLAAFVVALLLATAVNIADERIAVGHIREALGLHALPNLIEQLLRRPHHLALEGEKRILTALACELEGFTAAAHNSEPKEAVRLLDGYLSAVSEIVLAHGGQIERVADTTVVAYWGAPLPNRTHALDACRCALRLKAELGACASTWRETLHVQLRPHVGVCTGELLVGNLSRRGSRARPRFAVFGPTMEAAKQLARTNEALETSVLIADATFDAAGEQIAVREIDLVRVASRARPLRAIELRSMRAEQSEADRVFVERFEKAVIAFRKREFKAALEELEAILAEAPQDTPCAMYVERCRVYLATPPAEDWDGVFEAPPPG